MELARDNDRGHDSLPWRVAGEEPDLTFENEWRPYATHALHPFPAKFPPALAEWMIKQLTEPGEWVLDPFVGSGTTLVEARILGRNAMAAELDPLSRLIARVKATPLEASAVDEAKDSICHRWTARSEAGDDLELEIPEFPNRDKWFDQSVQRDLVRLRDAIAQVEDVRIREFFAVVFSSLIIAKGPTSVANALDIAHSRAHYFSRAESPDVRARFEARYKRAIAGLKDMGARAAEGTKIAAFAEDARDLPYRAESAHAIVTSPPYVTAIEYPRSHKFSVWWLAPLLGVRVNVYDDLRSRYVGTDSVSLGERTELARNPSGVQRVQRLVEELDKLDSERSGQVRRYFRDMEQVLSEMLRVLKVDRYAALVVGDSNIKGIKVSTAECLVDVAAVVGDGGARFQHVDTLSRTIRERSRQMPIKRGSNGEGIRTEHVLIFRKLAGV